MTEPADWVRLTSVSDQYEADLLTGRLESVGIDSRSSKSVEAPGAWLTGSQNPFGPIEILVPSDQLETAQGSLGSVEPAADPSAGATPRPSRRAMMVVGAVLVVALVIGVLAAVLTDTMG